MDFIELALIPLYVAVNKFQPLDSFNEDDVAGVVVTPSVEGEIAVVVLFVEPEADGIFEANVIFAHF